MIEIFKSVGPLVAILVTATIFCQAQPDKEITNIGLTQRVAIKTKGDVFWWNGITNHGNIMPLQPGYQSDTKYNNYSNQVQPLLLSNKGEVIWSSEPFKVEFTADSLMVSSNSKSLSYIKVGKTLKEAYLFSIKTYFPASGRMPDPMLFSKPQYNTWIELMYDQNQKDILQYANDIISHGMPAGVLMIDDNWQEDYGKLKFHPGRFPSPKQMVDSLHEKGFKVMLWVCPFISPDCDVYRKLSAEGLLLKDSTGYNAIVRWWNGASALLDFTNPKAVDWFKSQLNFLMTEYHVDGFKFDAGDFEFYKGLTSFNKATPTEHAELYAKIGLNYPLNEYRAMWKMGGQPLVNRLCDKNHSWEDLQKLIPNMIIEGLMGYTFSCPDMIGGGEFKSFLNKATIDQELIVRSAQCHAFMPMMQFSVAPWRVLDQKHFNSVLKAVALREKFSAYILRIASESATTGEPILRSMEYSFPNQGYQLINDQFLLGDSMLVAPVIEKNCKSKKLQVPAGIWEDSKGQQIKGPKTIEINVALDEIPFLKKIR